MIRLFHCSLKNRPKNDFLCNGDHDIERHHDDVDCAMAYPLLFWDVLFVEYIGNVMGHTRVLVSNQPVGHAEGAHCDTEGDVAKPVERSCLALVPEEVSHAADYGCGGAYQEQS